MSVNGKVIESQGRSAVVHYVPSECDYCNKNGECDYCNKNADCKAFCWYCKKARQMCRNHLVQYLSTAYGIVADEEGDKFVMRPCRCYDCETSIESKLDALISGLVKGKDKKENEQTL